MKRAKDWLETAIKYENQGNDKLAEAALRKAIDVDETEHQADPESASLPRLTQR